jgi:ribosome-associated protein
MGVTEKKVAKKVGAKRKDSSQELARRAAALALEMKGESILILDLRGLSSACDFFVLATGLSEVQVKAMADRIEDALALDSIRPWHIEGRLQRRWILLDYVDVVVHLFHKETRDYYRLENLWADAPREEVTFDRSPSQPEAPSASGDLTDAPRPRKAPGRPKAGEGD